jgi:glyoxylase-like metal-dependent hydrolase (beta-lactamase superfamily II)
MTDVCQPLGNGVFAVDTEHVRPRADASYLLVEGGRAAFIDTGSAHSAANCLEALASLGLDPDSVEYILLTHIHLDHAGGAGSLARSLPRARVLVHPRGAAHLVDPSKLIAATRAVYGESGFGELFGDVVPVAAERLAAIEDGERLRFGARMLEFIYTPGHALHHVCIVDRDTREAFTGDTFGISYRETDTAAGAFIFPTTTPAQFDPDQLHASVARIAALELRCAYLTHYSRVVELDKLAADLHADIDAFVRIARAAPGGRDRIGHIEGEMYRHLSARLDAHGFVRDERTRHAVLDGDVALNSAGLDAWLARVA